MKKKKCTALYLYYMEFPSIKIVNGYFINSVRYILLRVGENKISIYEIL